MASTTVPSQRPSGFLTKTRRSTADPLAYTKRYPARFNDFRRAGVTKLVQDKFFAILRGEDRRHEAWLTYL